MSNLSDEEEEILLILAELRGLEIMYGDVIGLPWWIRDEQAELGKKWLAAAETREEMLVELRRLVDRDFGFSRQGTSKGTEESGTG